MRAVEDEALACNAAVARLRDARKHGEVAQRSSSNNPLVLPPYSRRRKNLCSGCGRTSPDCCCSITRTGILRRRHSDWTLRCSGEKEEDTSTATAAAVLDAQSEASLPEERRPPHPCRSRKVVSGNGETSGIFIRRSGDGSPVRLRTAREAGSTSVEASSAEQSSKIPGVVAGACIGSNSRRGSPRQKRSCRCGSSACLQLSCSCCIPTQQRALGTHGCTSSGGAAELSGEFSSTEELLPPAAAAARGGLTHCATPDTTEAEGAGVGAAPAAAIHHRCAYMESTGTEETSGSAYASEPLYACGPTAIRQQVCSSPRLPSPSYTVRECLSPRPCSAHDASSAQLLFSEAAQQSEHQRQQKRQREHNVWRKRPQVHQSCFVEGKVLHTSGLQRRSSSPAGQGRSSPWSPAYTAGERSLSWPQRYVADNPQRQQREKQQSVEAAEKSSMEGGRETSTDAQETSLRGVAVVGEFDAGSSADVAVRDVSADKKCSTAVFTSAAAREVAAYVSAPDPDPYLPGGLPKPRPIYASGICSSIVNGVAAASSSAVAIASPLPSFDAREVERNSALIMGAEPQFRSSSSNMRPATTAPVTITFKHEKRSIWDDPPKPGEMPKIEKVHVVGRNWAITQ